MNLIIFELEGILTEIFFMAEKGFYMKNFELKCMQLDLARQKENIDFIKEFTMLAKDAGYNSVLLYLEDRIRTESYPYISVEDSYSVEEMRELVAFAESINIELIPCVATLGHAERFLKHPELAHLSEVTRGVKNRFGAEGSQDVFCMNHPEFYPFMEKYLEEVAEIFPSQYFHAGLDEFFNFNLCERCRKLMKNMLDEEKMFLKHIIRINDCLNKLGKRMMMWSDMFEIYTTVIQDVPKNIIMVDWQYQNDVRFYLGHLFELGVEKRMRVNDELGFTAVAAPADCNLTNPESCLKYASEKNAWGYLVTSWEKNDTFLYRVFPVFFYIGQLMTGKDTDEAWNSTVKYIFNTDDKILAQTVRLILAESVMRHFAEVGDGALCSRPFEGIALDAKMRYESLLVMLKDCKDKVNSDLGRKVYSDLLNVLEEKCIAYDFKTSFWDVIDYGRNPEFFARAEKARSRFAALLNKKSDDWKMWRNGITGNVFEARRESLLKRIDDKIAALEKGSYIKLRFCMSDIYVVNNFDLELRINGIWHKVSERNGAKPSGASALTEYVYFCDIEGTPEALKFTLRGMGGRGLAYIEICTADGQVFIPSEVIGIENIVEHAEYLLENDGKYAYFNIQSTRHNYVNVETAEVPHSVTLALKEDK